MTSQPTTSSSGHTRPQTSRKQAANKTGRSGKRRSGPPRNLLQNFTQGRNRLPTGIIAIFWMGSQIQSQGMDWAAATNSVQSRKLVSER